MNPMAPPRLPCPNCQSPIPLKEIVSTSSYRCTSCRAYLHVSHPHAFLFRLAAVLFTVILLISLRVDWFVFTVAFIPTLLFMAFLTSFVRFQVAPPKLEMAENKPKPSNLGLSQ